ncbi:PAS domain-containing protein [Calothrix sp. NIES-2098]|uniref:PAS domain-containing protein n=1 Tax=Calothrix sp. NIES-2098 TaxID=1954171 RepID=UPI000B616C99|nr:two-component sensor histidine kinase [Calothrix sp. NIES-2098]
MENSWQPEVAIEELERPLRAIFNQTFELMALMEPDGILIEINQTALDFAGLSGNDVLGLPLWEASWWQISKATRAKIREAIATAASGELAASKVDILGTGNTVATIDFTIRPIKNRSGRIILLIFKGRDISARQIAT